MLNSFTVVKNSNGLNRRVPSAFKVVGLVGTGLAVSGKLVLGTVYTLKSVNDAALIGIDAAYDNTNNLLVYHHIARLFLREPNAEVRFMLAPQTKSLTDLVDKTQAYAKSMLANAQGQIRYCGIFRNPASGYTPTLTTGLDADVWTAMANAQALYNDEAQYFRYCGFVIEGRQFNGTSAGAKDLHTLAYPNVSCTILADPAISGAKTQYLNYAAVGDVVGLKAHADLSQNIGELSPDFNLVNVSAGAFGDIGLSSGLPLSSYADTDLIALDTKGYIFGCYQGVDGFQLNDSYTASPIANNDFAYIENNSVVEEMIYEARAAILPKTKSRILIDAVTGLILPEIKAALENDLKNSLKPLVDSGDLSGGVDASIPDSYQDDEGETIVQNLLATDNIFFELSAVPVAIARSITLRIGFTNPNKN